MESVSYDTGQIFQFSEQIGLLRQTITCRTNAGGQAHYYSRSGTLKRPVTLDWLGSRCWKMFEISTRYPNAPDVSEKNYIMSLPSSVVGFVPCDRLWVLAGRKKAWFSRGCCHVADQMVRNLMPFKKCLLRLMSRFPNC